MTYRLTAEGSHQLLPFITMEVYCKLLPEERACYTLIDGDDMDENAVWQLPAPKAGSKTNTSAGKHDPDFEESYGLIGNY